MSMAAQRVRDYLIPGLGYVPIRALRPDHVRVYRVFLQEQQLAPRSVAHLLTDLRCMLRYAVDEQILEASPFPRRVMPRIQETEPDRLSDDEVALLLAIPEPQAFVIRLGLGTGLRWGEMCNARREHLRNGFLVVTQTKSSRLRRVPVSDSLGYEILQHDGPLVPYAQGTTTSFANFVRRNSGVAHFHVHQLRHTFACKWVEAGGSLPALQQILGHASVVTTQMYARLSDDSVAREAARIHGEQQR